MCAVSFTVRLASRINVTDLVEQPTGWPRHECHKIIKVLNRRHWFTAYIVPALAGLGFFWAWMYGYGAALQAMEDRGLNVAEWARAAPRLRLPLLVAAGLGVAFTGCVAVSVVVGRYWLRRHTRRYLAAPTCLTCRYPIAPEAGRCPECGGEIPAHLAEWHSARSERRGPRQGSTLMGGPSPRPQPR